MRRDEVLSILAAHKHEFARFHVRSLALFGSVARDAAGPHSDIDLLVEFDEMPGLVAFVQLENLLSDLLGAKVDLVLRSALKPAIGRRVLAEAVPV